MIERSDARDAAIRAALPCVPEHGWGNAALRAGLASRGEDPAAAEWLFARGPASLVEAWCDLADRDMASAAAAEGIGPPQPIPVRIRRLILLRLAQAAAHKEAVRRALGVLALPWNAGAALRSAARTADAIWAAAGDTSADFSWYTRRATVAGVYGATLAFWLGDEDPAMEATRGFLDRRLAALKRPKRSASPRAA